MRLFAIKMPLKKRSPKATKPTTPKKTVTKARTGKAAVAKKAKNDETANEPPSNPTPIANGKKRKADTVDGLPSPESKKARVAKPRVAKPRAKVVINHAPTTRLDVYVCGEGSSGELGLGSAKNAVDVKRPRLNPHLKANEVGVVQIAVGGMHCIALTHDNKILTWGVNDQGALGRNTTWEGGYKDIDDNKTDADTDSDDSGLNPYESTPTAIPAETFPEGVAFVEVAAADSSSFALTDEGQVYGWGTFRVSHGKILS